MTDEELESIRARYERAATFRLVGTGQPQLLIARSFEDIPRLLDEINRLRSLLANSPNNAS